MNLRYFVTSDAAAVLALFEQVFGNSEGPEEGELIRTLVDEMIQTTPDGDLKGFVAESEGVLVGSIFFSRLSLSSPQSAFILSPVAVATSCQGQGVGQALINEGIADLRAQGVDVLFTYGDPNYYARVGFQVIREEQVEAPFKLSHPEGWLAQSLTEGALENVEGPLSCIPALNKKAYW